MVSGFWKPEQRQAVSSLQKGEYVLAVLPSGFRKSMIFTAVFGIAEREGGRSSPVPIFACVQDGADDRELRFFRGFSAIKTTSNRLQGGCSKGWTTIFLREGHDISFCFKVPTVSIYNILWSVSYQSITHHCSLG